MGLRNVKHVSNCWRRHSAHIPYYGILIQTGPMCSSQMLVSMDGQEYSLNLTKRWMSQPSQLPMWVHHRRRQWFITLSHTSVDFSEEVSWTGLPLQRKPMLSTWSIRKLSFYLTNADVLIRSDHIPLKKFLRQNTMNTKVNNWAVELKSYNLKFKYIWGIKNTLTDTLSRLLEIDPDVALPAEPQGTEFSYNCFEELPPVEVVEIIVEGVKLKPNMDMFFKEVDLTLPLKSRSIRSLQAKDIVCQYWITPKITKNKDFQYLPFFTHTKFLQPL